jgi:hypothetical protein
LQTEKEEEYDLVSEYCAAEQDRESSFSETNSCDPTVASCPLQKSIRGRFAETEVKCGNNVELQADATNITDGNSAAFALKKLPGGEDIDSASANLSGSQVRRLSWVSKKPSEQWPEWEVDFDVSADGCSPRSENQLKFFRYQNQAVQTKTINRTTTDGSALRDGKFDIEFQDGVLLITIKIKLINRLGPKPDDGDPMPAAGGAVSDEDKQSMRADIEQKLSDKWLLHRQDCQRNESCDCPIVNKCCKFKVTVRVSFVENGEHHPVNLFQGSGRANSLNWTRIKTRDNSYAHETGHLLGWFDEYSGTTTPGSPPRWQVPRDGVIMNEGLDVPGEYYWDFRDWFANKTSESWELISP